MAIYNDKMWFGNRNYMQWVLAPQINYDSSKRGYASTATYLNGGAFVRRSATAAKGYNLSWNLKGRDEVRAINDYADGVYGDAPIYFLDPFAMDKNLMPQYWATPVLTERDAPLLAGEYEEDRPTKLVTPNNSLGYPYESAVFTLTNDMLFSTIWIPCPPGYSLWVGAHGTATGTAGVQVTPTLGPTTTAAAQTLTLLAATDTTRVNKQINGDTYSGALISLKGAGTLTLYGIMAQVFKNANQFVPPVGRFISGQGHTGCSFVEEPTLTNYSAAINKVGLSANLIETEGWK